MDLDIIGVVFRWLHVLPATIVVGGLYYMRLALAPSLGAVDVATRQQLAEQLRGRWARLVHTAIALLLISGLFNIARIARAYEVPAYYHPLFGVKFLIALAVFYVAIMLSGRSTAARRMQQNARFWLSLNVALVTVLVLISGVLRMAERSPKPAQDEPAATSSSDVSVGGEFVFDCGPHTT